MNGVDWLIVVLCLLLIPIGYRQGLIVGLLSLAGFALGAFLGARIGPLVLSEGSSSPYAPLTALIGGLLVGGTLAVVLEALGQEVRARVVKGRAGTNVDSAGGAVVMVVLGLLLAWVVGAVALNTPALKDIREDFQRSAIVSSLNDAFPPSGPLLHVLHRIDAPLRVEGPSADVPAPDPAILDAPGIEAARPSVVRVLGSACGLNISGSGWVAGDELVVTNAHVVAGEDDTTVVTGDGAELAAEATVYRPADDIAVLRVPGLSAAPLELADSPRKGTSGAVLGYPGAGDFSATAARLGTTGEVTSQDAYGEGPIQRRMTSLRGEVMSGNSGGPMLDADGRVLTTLFAAAVDSRRPEGLGVPNDIVAAAIAKAGEPVDTGPCVA